MPWELQALPSDDSGSLGTVEHVQAKLRAALPEIGEDKGSGVNAIRLVHNSAPLLGLPHLRNK